MKTVHEKAYAKLNISLDVGKRREDGFHEMTMVMQSISLADAVAVTLNDSGKVRARTSLPFIPGDERNLAVKAALCYLEAIGRQGQGALIEIQKAVPVGAGMGGGSSDAAAVLRALNRHFGAPLSILALAELGAKVGSDVPFCVLCGTAMVEGRGERLRKLPDLPDCVFVVCKPEFSVSTPELYKQLDTVAIAHHPDNQAMEAALLAGDLERIAENVYNVFDPVVTQDHLELNYIKSICNTYGALCQQMTGSGSAVFAMMPDFEMAAVVCNMLKDNYPQVYLAKPV